MYKTLFTDRSKKDLKNLDFNIQKGIVEKLNKYSTDPIHFSKKAGLVIIELHLI